MLNQELRLEYHLLHNYFKSGYNISIIFILFYRFSIVIIDLKLFFFEYFLFFGDTF